ncbi:Testis-expressed protein 14 [Papilio xuthus]|uniref:Testis-expressed protein 14 n=1 Tax=Papilio xuthus TaxID=66420 RepID=A0A194QCC8_PAPXU|nr:Testis-expressed protein 14 [Papilio xuthus]
MLNADFSEPNNGSNCLTERYTVAARQVDTESTDDQPPTATQGTIRTEQYKRDLAEFQARRSLGKEEPQNITPVRRKCGRHSLPASCTDCTGGDPDTTFNYEKNSAAKYKKKSRNARRASLDDKLPNIQFLFQNQVFMPGNMYSGSFSESAKARYQKRSQRSPDIDSVQRHIDFKDEELKSPSLFLKNDSLPCDVKKFIEGSKKIDDVDGMSSSHNSVRELNNDNSCEEKMWEVMNELKNFDQWADDQLQGQSANTTKSDDTKSDVSAYGLAVTSSSNMSVTLDKSRSWNTGKWGLVPVQIKKLHGVTIDHVKKKQNTEINILRKFRHPNIILLMGLYTDIHNNVNIICERCMDSLYGILHVQGRILSAQTSVQYALDIANALLFLRMQGYVHSRLSSASVLVTSHGTAKLADVAPCLRLSNKKREIKEYEFTPEPQYVNIQDTSGSVPADSELLLPQTVSEVYLTSNAVAQEYSTYRDSSHYRWLAPELFEPDALGQVYPCSKSDVYSLCLILWECCNATIPWKTLKYDKLKELYLTWKTGIRLPQDGSYPGALLATLQDGLQLARDQRTDLQTLQTTLQTLKSDLDDMEYIIIATRFPKTISNFSNQSWDTTSPTDSEGTSARIRHKVVVHKQNTSTDSDKDSQTLTSPLYETLRRTQIETIKQPEKCFISDDETVTDNLQPFLKFQHLPDNDFSSVCSTPVQAKIQPRIKELGTPVLHKSDSTEYCSILSPDTRGFSLTCSDTKDKSERSTTKLSRSFTPQSYKPLHIKVPDFKLDTLKSIVKDNERNERSSYNFDIKHYSLPATPIARSNKLRKNAWLSGDFSGQEKSAEKVRERTSVKEAYEKETQTSPMAGLGSGNEADAESSCSKAATPPRSPHAPHASHAPHAPHAPRSPGAASDNTARDSYTGLKRVEPPHDFLIPEDPEPRPRANSWSLRYRDTFSSKGKAEELANVNVKPLVAIHERWIHEANRKTTRSLSLPEDNKSEVRAVKPASHCVAMTSSVSALPGPGVRQVRTNYRLPPPPNKNGHPWDQCYHTRDAMSKSVNFAFDTDSCHTWKKDSSRGSSSSFDVKESKVDQSTSTRSIEEFIRELIRKEFQNHEFDDTSARNEEMINKGVTNVLEGLKSDESDKKETVKSFSRVKINGNNKPLLQITFSRSGENSLQVLDNCVNVTICDTNSGKDKLQDEEIPLEDLQVNSLKRCQAFNAIQEARSTEDLYIDDDLSTQMQENFGGKVKLIPLHGSLHEILCEKEDDCCLIKVKQENGCDTIYFRCDNSDTESRDAIDGLRENGPQDTVVFKRSISLIEERIQRVISKDKRPITIRKRIENKARPKSDFFPKITKETRVLSNSSPSLIMKDRKNDEVEVNIENVMCYQDSSSDECLKYSENDDFEILEREIEEDIANSNLTSLNSKCLEKISEENLSVIND